jgi:hypothetical protein
MKAKASEKSRNRKTRRSFPEETLHPGRLARAERRSGSERGGGGVIPPF